ncbi:hypothetical protein AOQ84DRAFT_159172 [Glonium stellatum]|uniref:NACHT domain-containing protein n=1 Tax=Glonium stellatum TaxID=574774 RepID=A0A8E2F923_9PEZI|nr:hypothetical protein AOQ84DRAFT_159172 [Glonium stellatum]
MLNSETQVVCSSAVSEQTKQASDYELLYTRSYLETIYEPRDISGPISDIVFVHGLNGHRRASWSWCGFDGMDPTFWPAAFLSRDVPCSRILTYGYDTERKSTRRNTIATTLQSAARFLLSHLAALRGHSNSKRRNILFITHNFGGLVVEKALLLSESDYRNRGIYSSTIGIIFLGATVLGIPEEEIGLETSDSSEDQRLASEKLAQGKHDSWPKRTNFLFEKVQSDFRRLMSEKGHRINIAYFYEELRLPGIMQVQADSWINGGRFPYLPLHKTYSELVKFASPNDVAYKRILGEIKKMIQPLSFLTLGSRREDRAFLESLSFPEMEEAVKVDDLVADSTCVWLFEHPKYRQWLTQSGSTILWIKGKPGSGKSTLMTSLVHEFQQSVSRHYKPALVATFLFRSGGHFMRRSASGLFQSLLYQVFPQVPMFLAKVTNTFNAKCEEVGRPGKDWHWDPSEVKDLLEHSLLYASQHFELVIIIDALDKCEEHARNDVIDYWQRFPSSTIKVCISSRQVRLPPQAKEAEIFVDSENHRDIANYVRHKVYRSTSDQKLATVITDAVIKKAQGVFLWASLVISHIWSEEGSQDLEELIHAIPKDLDDLYGHILGKIAENDQSLLARQIIAWVACAARPLSFNELQHALSVRTGPARNEPYTSDKIKTTRSTLEKICGGLVEVRNIEQPVLADGRKPRVGHRNVVCFVHVTVKEYLFRNGLTVLDPGSSSIDDAVGQCHYNLARTCVIYFGSVDLSSLGNETSVLALRYPFLHYAVTFWTYHAQFSERRGVSQMNLLHCFDWPPDRSLQHWMHIREELYKDSGHSAVPQTSFLHLASEDGLLSVANAIFEVDLTTNPSRLRNDRGRTPLSLAASEGYESLVKLLLGRGASANSKDFPIGTSPLMRASKRGHEAVVRLLLASGADTNHEGSQSALSLAAAGGHLSVAKLLIHAGAEPNLKDSLGYSPLS